METIEIFLAEFWAPLIGASIGVLLVWSLKQYGPNSRVPFLNAKAFPELSTHSKLEQSRLLHESSVLACGHWRSLVPPVVVALSFATGAALSRTLSETRTIPDSNWARAIVCAAFAVPGGLLAIRLTTHYLRPFLRTSLEKSGQRA